VLTDTDPAAPQVVLIGEGDNVPQALLDAANNVVALSVRTPPRTIESRCMSPEVLGTFRTWRDVRPKSVFGGIAEVEFRSVRSESGRVEMWRGGVR
jgi:hypothetical protein